MDRKGQITTKIIIIFSLVIFLISVSIIYFLRAQPKPLAGQNETLTNSEVPIGGDFTGFFDQNGQPFSSDNLKGKLSLVYFGFTYCPDVCPTTLNKLSYVIDVLTKYYIDINPVFVTIDPERDTEIVLKEYLGHFHSKFIGLRANLTKTKELADIYKVFYMKAPSENNDPTKYMMDHSSFCYLMNKNGKYLKHFTLNTPAEEIIEYIRINGK